MTPEPTLGRRSPTLARALETARAAHAGQTRYDGSPYLEHPVRVADLLDREGLAEPVLAAALLHDAVEDSQLTVGEVVERFGPEIGEIVAALTEDAAIEDWVERKDALRARSSRPAPRRRRSTPPTSSRSCARPARCTRATARGRSTSTRRRASTSGSRAWRDDLEAARGAGAPAGLLEPLGEELARFEAERRRAPGAGLAWRLGAPARGQEAPAPG